MSILHVVSMSGGKDSTATASKQCSLCLKVLPLDQFYAQKRAPDGRQYRCKKCQDGYRMAERVEAKAAGRLNASQINYRRLRLEVFSRYIPHGSSKPCCACCGEATSEFLSVDHIEGGGRQHRQQIGKLGSTFYRWLKNNGYPSGFRLLCHNCNQALENWGYCPHQQGSFYVERQA